jgi:hypothetical protein
MTMDLKQNEHHVRSGADLLATGARSAGKAGGAWR